MIFVVVTSNHYQKLMYTDNHFKCAVPRDERRKSYRASFARTLGFLAATAQPQHQVQGGLLLDVVVGKSAAILELLAGKDQALLIGGDALLVLDLALDHVDGVGALDLEGNGLA